MAVEPVEPVEKARTWGEATARELIAARMASQGQPPTASSMQDWLDLVERALAEPRPERTASLLTALADLGVDGVEAGEWLPKRRSTLSTTARGRTATDGAAGPVAPSVGPVGPSRRERTGRGIAVRIGLAVVIGLLIKTFALQVFVIPSTSMTPTLNPGERLAVDKISFRLTGIARGDLVVFRAPAPGISEHDTLVKRAVAVGGDQVGAVGGALLVNGAPVDEPYLAPDTQTLDFGPLLVPEGHLFVMGDNRLDSLDSRSFGPIDARLVIGEPRLRVWPPKGVGGL